MTSSLGGEERFHFFRGRVALHALLRALDVRAGDEVLLQAFTCLAVPSPVVGLGARPVYLDIDESTYNLDPVALESRVTPRTRAIIVQHTFGIPARMDVVTTVARRHGLAVIEDCCHVLGSTYEGQPVGALGDAAFYSFEWGKPVVVGLGGAAVVRSPALRERLAALYADFEAPPAKDALLLQLQYLAHGVLRRPGLFWVVRDIYHRLAAAGVLVGTFRREEFDGRLSDDYRRRMPAALQARLRAKLEGIGAMIAGRRRVAARYEAGLVGLGLPRVTPPPGADTVYLRYPLLVADKAAVLAEARRWRVELGDWFASPVDPLTEDQWAAVGYDKGACPVAEAVSRRIVTLPIYDAVRDADIDRALEFLGAMRARGLA